jgi:hypothetical protein
VAASHDDHSGVLVDGERLPGHGRPVESGWAASLKRLPETANGDDERSILLAQAMHQDLGRPPWTDRRWIPYTSSTIDTGE